MAKTMFDLLQGALEDLGEDNFKKFTSKMTDHGFESRVPKGAVEGKDYIDIAKLLIEHYTESPALKITLQIMRNINANQIAVNLEKDAAANGFSTSDGSGCPAPQAPVQNVPPPQAAAVTPGDMPDTSGTLIASSDQFKQDIISEKGQEIYPVFNQVGRKRLALMINNVEFDCKRMRRNGAEKDQENMEKLLRALGYDVVIHNDLSAKRMDKAIRSFAGRSEHTKSDSTFVVIMSHGERDKIFGIHHEANKRDDFLPVDNIFNHLNTENCPALLNKPKVILIQACRRGNYVREFSDSESDDMELDSAPEYKEKDFGALFSCTPDTVSFRNVKHGTYFIGFLVEVFNKNAHKEHIEELFRQVMRRFENFKRFGQMACKERSSLPKLFYLFPGL